MNKPAVAHEVMIQTHTKGQPTSTNLPLSLTEVDHLVRNIAEYMLAREKMMWKKEYEYESGAKEGGNNDVAMEDLELRDVGYPIHIEDVTGPRLLYGQQKERSNYNGRINLSIALIRAVVFARDMEYALDKKNTSMQMDHLDDIQFSAFIRHCSILDIITQAWMIRLATYLERESEVTKQHKEDCKQLFRLMRVLVIELVQDPSKHNDVESLSRVEDGTLDQHQHPQDPEAFLEEEDYSIERHHQLPLNNPNLKSTPSLSGQLVFL
ncbi:hypothetical protein Tco_1484499 [Tanacetum coccineum]